MLAVAAKRAGNRCVKSADLIRSPPIDRTFVKRLRPVSKGVRKAKPHNHPHWTYEAGERVASLRTPKPKPLHVTHRESPSGSIRRGRRPRPLSYRPHAARNPGVRKKATLATPETLTVQLRDFTTERTRVPILRQKGDRFASSIKTHTRFPLFPVAVPGTRTLGPTTGAEFL